MHRIHQYDDTNRNNIDRSFLYAIEFIFDREHVEDTNNGERKMEPMRISMVCMRSIVGDIDNNSKRMLELIDQLSSEGSDLICFPELSLTGYSSQSSTRYAMSLDDPAIKRIVKTTEDKEIIVCFGFVEQGPYITQLIAENGKICGTYRKTHLGEREQGAFLLGSSFPVIRTSKANIGIQICWESHFPQITAKYAIEGADLVLMPHASGLSGERRRNTWNKILPARAYDNTLFVASCNMTGDNGKGTVFGGGSCIIDERGNILAEDYSGECVVSADLDPKNMDRVRSSGYETMRDLCFIDKVRWELFR